MNVTLPTDAQRYLHRARMFRDATIRLVDDSNGESFWPKYALLTHTIELALKAFALHHSVERRPKNHDLRGWYDVALERGLPPNAAISKNIDSLTDFHAEHVARYPADSWSGPVDELATTAEQTTEYLISEFTRVINPR